MSRAVRWHRRQASLPGESRMKHGLIGPFGCALVCLAWLVSGSQAHAAAFNGRGVFHFASAGDCPAPSQAVASTCHRIALDVADAHARVDSATHTIVIDADADHDRKTVIGDVLLHGSGVAADGQRVPLSLHVLLRRSGNTWKPDTYVHAPVRGTFTAIELEPYQIGVRDGAGVRVLLTAGQARKALAEPSLAARVAGYFVRVRPSDANNPGANDITVSLGMGRLSKPLLRAGFTADQPGTAPLDVVLASGTWNLRLQALSSQVPVWAVQRQLFVFGLDASPLLSGVRQRGFNKRDTLELGAVNGTGYLRLNGVEERFPAAASAGAAFMRESFIGLILAWHRRLPATPSAARPAP